MGQELQNQQALVCNIPFLPTGDSATPRAGVICLSRGKRECTVPWLPKQSFTMSSATGS